MPTSGGMTLVAGRPKQRWAARGVTDGYRRELHRDLRQARDKKVLAAPYEFFENGFG